MLAKKGLELGLPLFGNDAKRVVSACKNCVAYLFQNDIRSRIDSMKTKHIAQMHATDEMIDARKTDTFLSSHLCNLLDLDPGVH